MIWFVLLAVAIGVYLWWDTARINRRRDEGPVTSYYNVSERRLAKRQEDDARLALRSQRTVRAEPK